MISYKEPKRRLKSLKDPLGLNSGVRGWQVQEILFRNVCPGKEHEWGKKQKTKKDV